MTADRELLELSERAGVFAQFKDMQGQIHRTTPDTARALMRANGLDVSSRNEVREALQRLKAVQKEAFVPKDIIVEAQKTKSFPIPCPLAWQITTEDTAQELYAGRAESALRLPGMNVGIYILHLTGASGSQSATLMVKPKSAPSLRSVAGSETAWGVVAALYGLYQDRSQLVGSYDDLGALAQVLGDVGAGFLGINPVHALGWAAQETISPYSPTHRGFLASDHIGLKAAPGKKSSVQTGLIDYEHFREGQRSGLFQEYSAFLTTATSDEMLDFRAYCDDGGSVLASFACYETLSETHGPDWRSWPVEARDGKLTTSRDLTRDRFHMWLQWRADQQLETAQLSAKSSGMSLGLYLDLAVGSRLGGAESWGEASVHAEGVSLGAPPDMLSPAGQNWQLTALSPHRLQQTRYKAFRHILAQNLNHCGILRIDHALGLNRSFWIPEDRSPGGYIRQPFEALTALISIEAHRAGAVVIGEDLGLVPQGFRERMASVGVYGYTVLQYEKDSSGQFRSGETLRPQSLACFGTHDTPTLSGFWEEKDISWWRKLGWIDAAGEKTARIARAREKTQLASALPAPVDPEGLRDHVHTRLARSTCRLVAAQLDDILMVPDAQNLPGTVSAHPNWQRRYPQSIADIAASDALASTADIMTAAGRSSTKPNSRKESS